MIENHVCKKYGREAEIRLSCPMDSGKSAESM